MKKTFSLFLTILCISFSGFCSFAADTGNAIETGTAAGIDRYYKANESCRRYNTIGGIRETTDAQYGTVFRKKTNS